MKTSRKLLLAGAAVISTTAVASSAFAQASASTSATASATILQPITIAVNGSGTLGFGTIVRGAGTVTISETDGTRSASGVSTVGSTGVSRADFRVSGEGGQAITITVPATATMNGPSASTLPVALTHTSFPSTLSGALGATGTADFGVGGSITLTSGTTNGAYSGTFNVSAVYN